MLPNNSSIYDLKLTHTIQAKEYFQIISIDPAQINCAFRIERRYLNSTKVETLVMDKIALRPSKLKISPNEKMTIMIKTLTDFYNSHRSEILETDYIIIEKQVHNNYYATRISQHIISYFYKVIL